MGPAKGNPRGHFEDVDFYNFHEKILRRFGQSLLVQDVATLGRITSEETQEALTLIKQRSAYEVWGWKDPRTSLFLEFWHSLLPTACYVFVYRHPVEVALSLLRRGTDSDALVDPMASVRAWQVHNECILDFYQKHTEVCILCNIFSIAEKIEAFIDLVEKKLTLSLQKEGIQSLFYPNELRRVVTSVELDSILRQIAPETAELYEQLEAQADLPGHASEQMAVQQNAQIVDLQRSISSLVEKGKLPEAQLPWLFSLLLTILDPQAVLGGKEALEAHIKNLEEHLRDLTAHAKNLEQLVASKETHIQSLEQRIAAMERTITWRFASKLYAFYRSASRLSKRLLAADVKLASYEQVASSVAPSPQGEASSANLTPKILFISHDAERCGAPILLLHFLRWLKANTDIPFEILLKMDGELRPEFEALAPVVVWNQGLSVNEAVPVNTSVSAIISWARKVTRRLGLEATVRKIYAITRMVQPSQTHIERLKQHLEQANIGLIYSNTITNGAILAALSSLNCHVICHVHELEYWINYQTEWGNTEQIKKHTSHYIAVSQAVKRNLVESLRIPEDKIDIVYEFIPTQPGISQTQNRIRQQLNIPPEAFVVGASGTTDWRKGPDLFIQLARTVYQRKPERPVHFIWVGGESKGPTFGALWHDAKHIGLEDCIHFVGTQPNPLDYFVTFDVFALVSREDPYPLVNLEVASLGKPIVCFDGSGGAKEFVEDDCGFVVPYLDIETMADRVVDLLNSPELRQRFGQQAAKKVRERHDVAIAAPKLLGIIERFLKRYNRNYSPDFKPYRVQVLHPLHAHRPRIVYAIANFITGGSSQLVVDLIEHLGHRFEQEIITYYNPKSPCYVGQEIHDYRDLSHHQELLPYLEKFKPDLLHVHYWNWADEAWYRCVFKAAQVYGCKIIENINVPVKPYVDSAISWYVYVSDYVRRGFGRPDDPNLVIYPGSDLNFFRRRPGQSIPDNCIGMVYRLDTDKVNERSIEVFIKVVQRRRGTKVLIVGGGSNLELYRETVRQAGLSEAFTFTGYVSYEQLPAFYEQFSIFVAPVVRESFGQVSPFAMGMEIPVVGYNVGALKEILGTNELLASPGDSDTLADIIIELLNNRDKRLRIGAANRQRAQQLFSVEAMVQKYSALYDQVLRNCGRKESE